MFKPTDYLNKSEETLWLWYLDKDPELYSICVKRTSCKILILLYYAEKRDPWSLYYLVMTLIFFFYIKQDKFWKDVNEAQDWVTTFILTPLHIL